MNLPPTEWKVLLLSEQGSSTERVILAARLDQDIVTQGRDAAEALDRLHRTSLAHEFFQEKALREGRRVRVLPPIPLIYARMYGLSAIWDGRVSFGGLVRIWHGEPPDQWSVSKRFSKRAPS